jgi:hypothetical protein
VREVLRQSYGEEHEQNHAERTGSHPALEPGSCFGGVEQECEQGREEQGDHAKVASALPEALTLHGGRDEDVGCEPRECGDRKNCEDGLALSREEDERGRQQQIEVFFHRERPEVAGETSGEGVANEDGKVISHKEDCAPPRGPIVWNQAQESDDRDDPEIEIGRWEDAEGAADVEALQADVIAKKRSTPKAPTPTIRDMAGPAGIWGAWLSRTIPMAMARHPSRVGMYPDLRDGERVSRDFGRSFTG